MLNYYYRSRIAAKLNSSRSELHLRSVFLPRLNAIYLTNPKVAGSTVIATLIAADDSPHLSSIADHNASSSRRLMSSEQDPRRFWRALNDPKCFRFSFVRDPFTRIESCYLDKIVPNAFPHFRRQLGLPASGEVSFLDFLRHVAKQRPKAMNRHWRPQSDLISPNVPLGFIGRFETFDAHFAYVLDRLNISLPRESRGHSTGVGLEPKLAGPEEISLIREIYRADFERFGYKD